MVVVFATAKWTPWVFLAFVAAWQRFNPDNLPQPIVLDEQSGLDERFKSRFVAVASVSTPGRAAGICSLYEMEDYIGGISTEEWPEEVGFSGGELQVISLNLEPEGVMPVSGWIQMRIEGLDLRSGFSAPIVLIFQRHVDSMVLRSPRLAS